MPLRNCAHPPCPLAFIPRPGLPKPPKAGRLASPQRQPCTCALRVYRVATHLVGAPTWARLHSVSLLVDADTQREWLADFLPREPTSPQTMLTLIRWRAVDGVVRLEETSAAVRRRKAMSAPVAACESRKTMAEVRLFCAEYPAQLRLGSNDCRTFTRALEAYIRA